ncbi:MAG: helicase-related protein [Bacteriovoracia bacterium]
MQFHSHTFQLLLAPPAWGKTRLFSSWVESSHTEFLYICPLRALALEVQKSNPSVWVALPEELLSLDWEALAQKKPNLVVVWDEVHLVPEWGLTFRHALMEAWYGFCLSGLAGVGFTATLTPQTRHFLEESLCENHEWLLIGDAGNFRYKHEPRAILAGPTTQISELLLDQNDDVRTLVFCATRGDVDRWLVLFGKQSISAWGCKGGETRAFSERLAVEAAPRVIVATSCLSHGVNLPPLDRVVILDAAAPAWLVHQMQTRAGRRGEPYEIWMSWRAASLTGPQRLLAFWRFSCRLLNVRLHHFIRANWYES